MPLITYTSCMEQAVPSPLAILREIPEAYGLTRKDIDSAEFHGLGLEAIARMALDRFALSKMGEK